MMVFLWSNDLIFNVGIVLTYLVFFGKLAVGAISTEGEVCDAKKHASGLISNCVSNIKEDVFVDFSIHCEWVGANMYRHSCDPACL